MIILRWPLHYIQLLAILFTFVFSGCAVDGHGTDEMTESSGLSSFIPAWRLTSINGTVTSASKTGSINDPYHMRIDEDGSFMLRLSCVWITGEIDGEYQVFLEPRDPANDMCSQGERAEETKVYEALSGNRFRFSEGLEKETVTRGSTTLIFEALKAKTGPGTLYASVLGNYDIVSVNGKPVRQTESRRPGITLERYRISVQSGCNGGGGEIDWDGLSFRVTEPFVQTAMACGDLEEQEADIFGIGMGATIVPVGESIILKSTNGEVTARKR